MELIINEQKKIVKESNTLGELIVEFDIDVAGAAIAVGSKVVPRSEWGTFKVNNGEKISVFKAIAGG
jgi:sulfur carrier protein